MSNQDPFIGQNAVNLGLTDDQLRALRRQQQEAAAQQCPADDNAASSLTEYTPHRLRLRCLGMALLVPDGAAPPPLAEVIERAIAYWHFISKGE
jgi:hypothetical protein